MPRRGFLLFFLVSQFLTTKTCFGNEADEEIECVCEEPVARVERSIRLDHLVSREDCKRDVIERLLSYFRWPPYAIGEVQTPVPITQGVGEVFVHGENIFTDGVTEVDGTVPIGGCVTFCGPVRASGSVTIAGRCAPASGASPLRIGQPLLPERLLQAPIPPVIAPAPEVLPLPAYIPTSVPEILPIIDPDPLPTIILPPVVIPAIVIPAYVIPEVVIPASDVYDLGCGTGNIIVSGNDVVVDGATYVEGSVPTVGEVTFSGYVPAKGTVTICSCL